MIALGVDPGSKRNCGWALVDGERVVKAGIVEANGKAISELYGEHLLSQLDASLRFHSGGERIGLVAIEAQHAAFPAVAMALGRVVGRWLFLAERHGVPTVEVFPSQWMAMFISPSYATPRTVVDPKTGKKRKLFPAEKTREEVYRLHAVEQLGLPDDLPADAAAAAWIARYAIETWEGDDDRRENR